LISSEVVGKKAPPPKCAKEKAQPPKLFKRGKGGAEEPLCQKVCHEKEHRKK
jgi:hypothetical protein